MTYFGLLVVLVTYFGLVVVLAGDFMTHRNGLSPGISRDVHNTCFMGIPDVLQAF